MKSQVAIAICLAAFSLSASAMPHASLGQLMQKASDANCDQAGTDGGLRDLIQEIGIIVQRNEKGQIILNDQGTKDPRDSIVKLGPKLGMSALEIERARKTTGYVVCPGSKYNNGAMGAGALVGQGNQIITSAHLFIDEDGLLREPLSECYFQNQASPNTRQKLNFSSKDVYKMFTSFPSTDDENDLAVVRLKGEILTEGDRARKITPFPIDDSGAPLKKGQPIVMVSAFGQNMEKKVDANMPVVQGCHYMTNSGFMGSRRVDGVYTDCTSSPGQSGSIQLIRTAGGELAIRAITANQPKGTMYMDNLEFNMEPKEKLVYTYASEITSKIANDINNFVVANDNSKTFIREASRAN